MLSSRKPKIAFALALLLLCVSGVAAGFAISLLYAAENQVHHTYEVEVAIGDLEFALNDIGRYRVAYLNSTAPDSLQKFEDAIKTTGLELGRLRQLTADSATQQALCNRLETSANQRIGLSRESVDLKQQKNADPKNQLQMTFDIAKTTFETVSITQEMRQTEDMLLQQRTHLSQILFVAIPGILLLSFLLSAWMFWLHYQLLNRELEERISTESQLRHLSLQLMRVQDEEHRRFARELHDGLGQSLAGAKMIVDSMVTGNSEDTKMADLAAILGDSLSQVRTISYLFHPPFLDEIGFPSAATWLIEGYAQRTGVAVSMNIPKPEKRLPRSLELTLYRVLQESFSNIQRHSKSAKVDVSVLIDAERVTLRVKDDGRGIPDETLAAFQANAAHDGVGLTGMKERVKEQAGKLDVVSDGTGTEIIVEIPLIAHVQSDESQRAGSVRSQREIRTT